MNLSVVIPVYRNEGSIPELVERLHRLALGWSAGSFEVVFVVDGSPDSSEQRLAEELTRHDLPATVLALTRNFGSFAAIRAGLEAASGDTFAVIAADLQEPPELVLELVAPLAESGVDLTVGRRLAREDPISSRIASWLFWSAFRRLVLPAVPIGGVDVFACSTRLRNHILSLEESRSSLVGLVLWLGFQPVEVPYRRLVRRHGKSAWSFRKKFRYMLDSIFAFSDLPLRLLEGLGALGMVTSLVLALIVVGARLFGQIAVPGYAATAVLVLFFGGLNALGLGIVGEYVARAHENTKRRPGWVVARRRAFSQPSQRECS